MDAQLKSLLTSILTALASSIATAAAGVGIITTQQETQFASIMVSIVMYLIAAGLVWYKKLQHTPEAEIAAVNNAPNGVKVVPESSPTPAVTTPIKG